MLRPVAGFYFSGEHLSGVKKCFEYGSFLLIRKEHDVVAVTAHKAMK